ncbi:MAG: DUF3105 domain-containing protein [Myxococcaceae bacterium]
MRAWLLAGAVSLCACGTPMPGTDGGVMPLSVTRVDAGCAITIEEWASAGQQHVPTSSSPTWPSNPPASGPHFPVWAAFQEFSSPVPRGYWVHDLEHGAIVLLHRCDGLDAATCDGVKAALRQASASLSDDPKCTAPIRVRTVITPDPLLTEPLVAVSWRFIYRAACVDQPSLEAFVKAHYAQAPEDECANGVTSF